MKDSVLDILIHLFENFLDAEDDATPDREALKSELEQAGYPEAEIERALVWLESLATDPERVLGEGRRHADVGRRQAAERHPGPRQQG